MKSKLLLFAFLFLISSVSFSQITRKVLFEEGTNASCGPCASSNPILDGWLASNAANTIAIKYHASWPGTDPMYSANPTQNTERIVTYYNMGASGVPYCNCDGVIQDIWPFTTTAFTNAYNQRMAVTPLLGITVTDQRIAGDSVKSTVVINIPSALPSGSYKIRVMAIERRIQYAIPPGGNGETLFKDVFRWAYPNTTGVDCPTAAGTYSYTYTYKRLSTWVDSLINTVAFVQNDNNKEVMNSARGTYTVTGTGNQNTELPKDFMLEQNYPNPFNPVTIIRYRLPVDGNVSLRVYDLLGKEMAVLVNGFSPAGNFSVEFDASSLPSGVYFYKLITEGFSDTKKLVINK
jgi:hypothetical protein